MAAASWAREALADAVAGGVAQLGHDAGHDTVGGGGHAGLWWKCVESGWHGQWHDAGRAGFLAFCGQRCEWNVAGCGLFPGLVAAAGLAGQSRHVALHTLAGTWRRIPRLFAVIADVCTDFTEHAVAQLAELFTDQPFVWSFADLAPLFAHQPELFTYKSELLAYKPELFAHKSELFTDLAIVFTHESELLAYKS